MHSNGIRISLSILFVIAWINYSDISRLNSFFWKSLRCYLIILKFEFLADTFNESNCCFSVFFWWKFSISWILFLILLVFLLLFLLLFWNILDAIIKYFILPFLTLLNQISFYLYCCILRLGNTGILCLCSTSILIWYLCNCCILI